jgi:hypothetical protein
MNNYKITLKTTAVIFGLVLIVVMDGCNKMKKDKSARAFIDRPFKDVAPEAVTVTVNSPDSAQTFTLKGGTVISVPDHTFVDEKGNPVTGKVDICYSGFQTAADIIVSGIPMTYDSAGTTGNFQTAGMFEIKGTQNGKPVFISKDKKINVQMASFVRGDDYNAYYLDTTARNWNYMNHGTSIDNPSGSKDTAVAVLPQKPIEPKEYDEKTPVFDINVDLNNYPELGEFKGLVWQYTGSDSKQDTNNSNWVYGFHWKTAKIKPYDLDKSQFMLLLENGKTKFETVVSPVLKGKNLEKARERFKQKMVKYSEALAHVEKVRAFRISQGELLRSFEVGNFGIYNCDKLYNANGSVTIAADFDIDGKTAETEKPVIFLITGNDRAVIKYSSSKWYAFAFIPDNNNKIIAVSPDQNVAVFSSKDFAAIDRNALNSSGSFTFHLKNTGKKISSAQSLQNIISTL